MKNIAKLAAGLALSGLCLAAHAQTTPMPQDRPSTNGQVLDKKMPDGKTKVKMGKGKMANGKTTKQDKVADDKTQVKL